MISYQYSDEYGRDNSAPAACKDFTEDIEGPPVSPVNLENSN